MRNIKVFYFIFFFFSNLQKKIQITKVISKNKTPIQLRLKLAEGKEALFLWSPNMEFIVNVLLRSSIFYLLVFGK